MPARAKAAATPPPLTDADVASLRAKVQAGEKPRVIVRTASAAVPAGTRGNVVRVGNPSDGEFIVVRLGKDEVPFAANELATTTKPSAASVAPVPAPTPKKKTAPPAKKAAAARPVKKAAASPSRKKSLPPLTVTLRFDGGGWTVEASRGARRLAKAVPVRPGAVKAFADLVDEPTVREAIVETVDSCRSVVEERAAGLRAELAAAEATLRDYDPRRR